MAWAAALGREGQVDSAVALYRTVTAPALRGSALDALAALLLKTATQDAAQAQYPLAIERLQEITQARAGYPQRPPGLAPAPHRTGGRGGAPDHGRTCRRCRGNAQHGGRGALGAGDEDS